MSSTLLILLAFAGSIVLTESEDIYIRIDQGLGGGVAGGPPAGPECMTEDGVQLSVGEWYTPIGKCRKYKCTRRHLMYIKECKQWTIPTDCKLLEADLTVNFPSCCPKMFCEKGYIGDKLEAAWKKEYSGKEDGGQKQGGRVNSGSPGGVVVSL